MGTLHVVGAGLAGLAAAVAAARAGARVVVHEAAGHAGGRCRSFFDDRLERVIDNGSHLLLGANRAALAFARAVGGDEALVAGEPVFPFHDLASGKRWTVEPGRLPVGLLELLRALGLPWTGAGQTVAERLGQAPGFSRLWQPLCEAILNAAPEEASARLFARVLRTAFTGGRQALTPWLAPAGLSAAFAAPAEATLGVFGGEMRFRRRLLAVDADALVFEGVRVALRPGDRVVLALPPWALAPVLRDGMGNVPTRAIVNAHFRLDRKAALPGGAPFMAVIGGTAHWLFAREDVLSVTVSAADRLAARPAPEIARRLWWDCARALGLAEDPIPPCRVLKERRATLAHTPEAVARRPAACTRFPAIVLAGDWIASPWPCTIEAAVSSGLAAARIALGRRTLDFT